MLLLLVGPVLASAAVLVFIEGEEMAPVGVIGESFDCGFQYTTGVEVAHAEGCWPSGPAGAAGRAVAYMVGPPQDPHAGAVSDVITIEFVVNADGQGHIIADFWSAPTGAPIEYPPAGIPLLAEDGTNQLLNSYFVDAAGLPVALPGNIQIYGNSDPGSATPVQPSTWGTLKVMYR
jgi:hypothetical protein